MQEFQSKTIWRFRLPFYIFGLFFIIIYLFSIAEDIDIDINSFLCYSNFLIFGLIFLALSFINFKSYKWVVRTIIYCLAGFMMTFPFFWTLLDNMNICRTPFDQEFGSFAVLPCFGIGILLLIGSLFIPNSKQK